MDEEAKKYLASGRALINGQIPTQEAPTGLANRPITADILSSNDALTPFKPVEQTQDLSLANLAVPAPAELTPEEKKAQDLSEQLRSLESATLGEEAYRSEQEKLQGIDTLRKSQRDLAAQLNNVVDQYEQAGEQVQDEALGTGRTKTYTATLTREKQGQLRRQAYVTRAAFDVAEGNLASAMDLVDRAVSDKYEPTKRAIEITKSNLQTIIDSPQYSLEQKNRAQAQLDKQAEKTRQVAKEESNQATIYGLALSAQQNGAPSAIVSKIMASKDLASALAGAQGFTAKETEQSILRYNFATKNGYKGSYTDFLNEEAARKRKETGVIDPVTGTTYATDLDALIGNVPNLIQSQNGKTAFASSIKRARNDADRINAIATVVLKNSPSELRNDFIKQTQGINAIDKAIAEIDKGASTGLLQNAAQYTFNLFGKDFDPKLAAINSYITSAVQPYRSSITGAAWGEQEEAEYANLFGTTKFSPKELKDRLTRLKEIMRDKSTIALSSQISPMSDTSIFAPSAPTPSVFNSPTGKTYNLPF